ncbi:MAG: MarR family transcriptional regulator [Actinomycetota bacterium]
MTETRWLSEDEVQAWRPLAAMLLLLPPHLGAALQPHGLTFFEYSTLVVLDASEDRTRSMTELAVLSNGELSRTSHSAKRLEQRGLIRRHRCPTDRRVTLVSLTEDGLALLAAAAPGHVESVRDAVFDALTPDEAIQLGRLAGNVMRRLDPDGPWDPATD